MNKVIIGSACIILTLILAVVAGLAYKNKHETAGTMFSLCIAVIGVMVSVAGLIIPGAVEIRDSKVTINTQNTEIYDSEVNIYTDAPVIVPPKSTGIKLEIDIRVRKNTGDTWQPCVFAKPGEEVEYQIYFRNDGDDVGNVTMLVTMPKSIEYIENSAVLYNNATASDEKTGYVFDNNISLDAVSIGGYGRYGEAYVRFRGRVIEEGLCDQNLLNTWVLCQVEDVQLKKAVAVSVIR